MDTPDCAWKMWHKFSFRFFFLFLGLASIFTWVMAIYFAYRAVGNAGYESLFPFFKPWSGLLHWLDRTIYHTGYDPAVHLSLPVDNHFGVVYYLTLFLLAILGTILWSAVDRGRPNYDRLSHWFNVYLRYALAITILGYGIDKVIPVQMPYPRTVEMVRLFGNQSKEDLLWKFIGISPGYSIFTGSCEILAGVLLLSRRTAVAGYLFVLVALSNVVALNWFYNVSVKLFSTLLWINAFYLLAPWLASVSQFFFSGKPAAIPQRDFAFRKKWKDYLLRGVLIGLPLLFFVLFGYSDMGRYRDEVKSARKEKRYKVTTFAVKDSGTAADRGMAADSVRWRSVLFVYDNDLVIFNMNDVQDWYHYDLDSVHKTFTLHGLYNPVVRTLTYDYPSEGIMRVAGKWKEAKDIDVLLKLSPVDSMYLNKEKMKIIQD